jgi:hypothetical protein
MKLFDSARELDLPSPPLAQSAWERARAKTLIRRRRRIALGAAFAVASVAVANAVVGGTSPNERPSDTPPTVAVVAPDCPTGSDPTSLPLVEPAALARGAVSVTMCPTQGADWQAPEPLTTGLDELVAQINARPATVPPPPDPVLDFRCMSDHPINDYTLAFTYPDGATEVIWGQTCGDTLRAGTVDSWTGAIAVWQYYLTSLEAQRADLTPAPPAPTSCPDTDYSLPESLLRGRPDLDLVSATVCTFVWTKVGQGAYNFVLSDSEPLSADQIARLNAGFATGARPIDSDSEVGNEVQSIVGVTEWGDQVQLEYLNGALIRFGSPAYPDEESIGWHLSIDDQDALGLDAS